MHEPSVNHRRPRLGCFFGVESREVFRYSLQDLFPAHPLWLPFLSGRLARRRVGRAEDDS